MDRGPLVQPLFSRFFGHLMPELCRPRVPQGSCNVTVSVSAAELSPKESKRAVDAHISGDLYCIRRKAVAAVMARSLQYSTRLGYLSMCWVILEDRG